VLGVVRVADGLTDASPGRHVVAVRGSPLADLPELLGVAPLGCTAAAGAAGTAVDLPGGGDVVGERFAECVRVVVSQVDFVGGTIETERDGLALAVVDGVAGEVVDKMRGDFLRHGGGRLSLEGRLYCGIFAPREALQVVLDDDAIGQT